MLIELFSNYDCENVYIVTMLFFFLFYERMLLINENNYLRYSSKGFKKCIFSEKLLV